MLLDAVQTTCQAPPSLSMQKIPYPQLQASDAYTYYFEGSLDSTARFFFTEYDNVYEPESRTGSAHSLASFVRVFCNCVLSLVILSALGVAE